MIGLEKRISKIYRNIHISIIRITLKIKNRVIYLNSYIFAHLILWIRKVFALRLPIMVAFVRFKQINKIDWILSQYFVL